MRGTMHNVIYKVLEARTPTYQSFRAQTTAYYTGMEARNAKKKSDKQGNSFSVARYGGYKCDLASGTLALAPVDKVRRAFP